MASWAAMIRSSRSPESRVAFRTAYTDEAVDASASAAEPVSFRCAVKSAAVRSPEPLAFIGSRGVRTAQAPASVTASSSMVSSGRSGRRNEVTSTVDGPSARAASAESSVEARSSGSVSVRNPSSNWLGVIRSATGHHLLADDRWDRGVDEATARGVAHHGVAGVRRGRVGRPHLGHGVHHDLADPGPAEVAGQHAVARREHAALGDAGDHGADVVGRQQRPAPGAVAGVVGEDDGGHGPDLVAESLQRERGRRVADVAVGDRRLDRQESHPVILSPPLSVTRPTVATWSDSSIRT